jgi:nucleotide-binding universal stress UspA family protein
MFRNILVPLDGSAVAARALPYAKRLARRAGARLIGVRAYLPADDALRVADPELSAAERAEVDRETATAEFQSAIEALRQDGLEVEAHFVEGAAADVIFETAKATCANLIVMSTHGRGGLGRVVYGSVADKVLRRVPVPVLLVPACYTQVWTDEQQPQPILVPLDGSSLAAEALPPARDLATALGAEMLGTESSARRGHRRTSGTTFARRRHTASEMRRGAEPVYCVPYRAEAHGIRSPPSEVSRRPRRRALRLCLYQPQSTLRFQS